MAITIENSTQYANAVATPPVKNAAYDAGVVRKYYFSHTEAAQGADGSSVNLIKLPAGKYRIILPESQIAISALGASRTVNVGFAAYTNYDGTAVAAVADQFISALDASSATVTAFTEGATTAVPTFLVNSTTEFIIRAVVAGGTLDAGETMQGYVTTVSA